MSDARALDGLPRHVAGLGVVLAVGMVLEAAAAAVAFPTDVVMISRLVTSAPFVAGLIYGGYRLSRSAVPPERYRRIGWWTLGGLVGFLLVNAGIMLAVPPVNALVLFGWMRWAVSLGASVGFLIGSFEARAIHREVVAERARVGFERVKARRDLLGYLDTLLSREIIPRADAIAKRGGDLADSGDPGATDGAAISEEARTLRTVLNHASYLLDPDGDAPGLEPRNLAATLREEVAGARATTGTTVECDVSEDDEWYVFADRQLPEVFGHLVSYLAERDDRSTPRVVVTCDPAPETVTVRVGCEGATVPESERETLFEYGAGDGDATELSLVATLVEYYGGSVELASSGDGGTTFAVTLRRVPVGTGDPPPGGRQRAPG